MYSLSNCFGGDLNSMALSKKIEVFNCSLSILSMFIISLISIYGLFVYIHMKKGILIFDIFNTFFLISYTFILQQSSSAHLMGYSYYFSIIFQ